MAEIASINPTDKRRIVVRPLELELGDWTPGRWASLITAILADAACLLAHPELSVIEVNPLFTYEHRAVSVDVAGYLRDIA